VLGLVAGPTIADCSASQAGFGACLRTRMADAGLIPGVTTTPADDVELTVLEPILPAPSAEPAVTVADVPAEPATPAAEPVTPTAEPVTPTAEPTTTVADVPAEPLTPTVDAAPATTVAPAVEPQPTTAVTEPRAVLPPAVEPQPPAVVAEPPPGEPVSLVTLLRVEPNGDMVLAGMGPPDAIIEVWANDRMIGTTTAEKSGDWVFVPDLPLGAGGTELTTRVQGSEAEPAQSFAIVVDQAFHDEPLVVASRPGEASSVLQGVARAVRPGEVPAVAPAPAPTTDVAAAPTEPPTPASAPPAASVAEVLSPTIDAIEIDGSRDFFAGAGAEGATVRLYVDGAFVADAQVIGGRWLVEAEDVLTKEAHRVRVDMLAAGSSAVAARAEVNFVIAVPVATVEPDVPTTPAPAATVAATEPGTPVETPTPTLATPEPAPTLQPETDVAVIEATPEVPRRTVTTPATPSVIDLSPPADASTAPDLIADASPAQTLPAPTAAPIQLTGAADVPTMLAVPTGAEEEGARFAAGKVIIRRGDNLWAIARRTYGDGLKYTMIFDANDDQIRNPNQIYPGQVFELPSELDVTE
jgi:nucleoid-associated protein YgaU